MMRAGRDVADAVRQHADELEQVVESAGDERAASRIDGRWGVKETLSHLQGAEGETYLDAIHRIIREDDPAIDMAPGTTHFNAERRDAPVGQLLSAVLAQYRAIAQVVEQADDETLARRAHVESAADMLLDARPTLAEWVAAAVEQHLAGHVADLQAKSRS
jgi:hypothetical protein